MITEGQLQSGECLQGSSHFINALLIPERRAKQTSPTQGDARCSMAPRGHELIRLIGLVFSIIGPVEVFSIETLTFIGESLGRSIEDSVVDSNGEVFDNPGLYVADAAALPRAPAGPPSMTIAAWANHLATRFIERHAKS